MPTAPQEVYHHETPFTGGTTKTTPTFDVLAGDYVTVALTQRHSVPGKTQNLAGGSLTWTRHLNWPSDMYLGLWSAPAIAPQSMTATVTIGGTNMPPSVDYWGFMLSVWRGSGGPGDSGAASGLGGTNNPPQRSLTVQEHSAVVAIIGDSYGKSGASRTWLTEGGTAEERIYSHVLNRYTAYGAVYPDVGAAGTYKFGLSAPPTGNWNMGALEMKGL